MTHAIPAPVRTLLDLFTTSLADVRFADVDGETLTRRALAYARVYAESDDALSGRLEAVSLPRALRRSRAEDVLVLSADVQPSARHRGRPRKTPVAEPPLDALVPRSD